MQPVDKMGILTQSPSTGSSLPGWVPSAGPGPDRVCCTPSRVSAPRKLGHPGKFAETYLNPGPVVALPNDVSFLRGVLAYGFPQRAFGPPYASSRREAPVDCCIHGVLPAATNSEASLPQPSAQAAPKQIGWADDGRSAESDHLTETRSPQPLRVGYYRYEYLSIDTRPS